MKKIFLSASALLIMSSVVMADDTVETCANGAGTVITGAVTGHKYCQSNKQMDWWNAISWCDALGQRLFSLDDCIYSVTGTSSCADLVGVGNTYIWSATPLTSLAAHYILLSTGKIGHDVRKIYLPALCH